MSRQKGKGKREKEKGKGKRRKGKGRWASTRGLVCPWPFALFPFPFALLLCYDAAMLRFLANRGVRECHGVSRRDFLRAGGLALGLDLADLARLKQLRAETESDRACIQLFLLGGPSQLD